MAVVDALVRLKADTAQFSKAMADASKATDKVGLSADKTSAFLGKKLKFGLLAAATAAAALTVKLGRDSVQAAQTAGAAQNRLRKLLLNTNGATEAQIQTLFAQGKALEDLTGISKENVTVVQSQLATFDLHGSTIGALTPAILDYVVAEKGASAGADEFRSMTNGLAQALNGQFGALTKQGFVLDAETKKMIKSGTESERAAAIVQVLGTTYRDFAATAGGPAAIAQRKFQNSINDTKEALGNALLPVIAETTGGLSKVLQPALDALQAKFADGSSVKNFIHFIKNLLKNLFDFGKAIVTVFAPIFTGLIVPAIKLAIGAVIGFIKVLGSIGRFISNNAAAFQVLVGAVVAVTAAIFAYIIQVKVVNAVHKAFIFIAGAKAKAIKILTRGFKTLNLVMKLNPIGAIIAAATLLIVGFAILYKKSETFRKILISVGKAGLIAIGFLIRVVGFLVEAFANLVTGPLKIFLKVLGFINPDAKKAYEGLKGITDGIGKSFDDGAAKIEGYSKALDNLGKKKVEPGFTASPFGGKKAAKPVLDLASLGTSNKASAVDLKAQKAAENAAKKLAEMQQNLKEAVNKYNDYLKFDFAKSFENGSEAARDAVLSALDNLNAVFEAKGKMMSGSALASLRKSFEKVTAEVRGMIEAYAALAGEIAEVGKKLEKAEDDLAKAIEERSQAMSKFGQLLATPFGEQSDVRKAMSSAEATVDSIIGMYDQLIDLVNQRFTELAPGARDAVKNYLYAQTNGLIDAARARVKAIKVLEAAQDRLDDLIGDQKQFSSSLTSSLKSFATAIADLSKTDSKATFTVIKTATGLVITQLKKSSGGIDTITEQLKQRLKTIADFAANANKLLASGLNREYVRQLLEAGPEAAGQAVTALATANAGQIAEINTLYSQIGVISDEFGTVTSEKMYAQAIAMTTAFRDGAALGVELINAVMTDIVSNISAILGILGNTGLTNAADLVNALIAEFTRQANETVGPATQLVVDKIKATILALGEIGLLNAQSFINGLISALTGKDNLNNLDLSATTIKNNIDTIMKMLAPDALVSGLGLINSLSTALGGVNLANVIASATSVKEGIKTALDSLRTLGTELATDLAQGLFDKLTAEKARLVALAQSIAKAIADAMAAAAASIGVTVETLPDVVIPDVVIPPVVIPKVTVDPDAHEKAIAAAGRGVIASQPKIVPKAVVPKAVIPRTLVTPPKAPSFLDKNKDGIPDLIAKPIPVMRAAPTPKTTTGPLGNFSMSTSGSGNQAPKFSTAAKPPVTVNISTTKVVPTVTATTISNAIDKARNARR